MPSIDNIWREILPHVNMQVPYCHHNTVTLSLISINCRLRITGNYFQVSNSFMVRQSSCAECSGLIDVNCSVSPHVRLSKTVLDQISCQWNTDSGYLELNFRLKRIAESGSSPYMMRIVSLKDKLFIRKETRGIDRNSLTIKGYFKELGRF